MCIVVLQACVGGILAIRIGSGCEGVELKKMHDWLLLMLDF